jgi:hypothetical protein
LQIYNSSAQIQNSNISFPYKISSDLATGDYYIVISGNQIQDIFGILKIGKDNGTVSAGV